MQRRLKLRDWLRKQRPNGWRKKLRNKGLPKRKLKPRDRGLPKKLRLKD